MRTKLLGITLLLVGGTVSGQEKDTLKERKSVINLPDVLIINQTNPSEVQRLPEVQGTVIYAGKKNEVIRLDKINADLSVNNARQVFAKIPGISIWENDGSGIQTGIASRGLSPNRSWEFNVRQNGYDISSEVFGYPESYFTPPLEAVERIEVVRGAASLQFGPQFGGLLNYEIKKGAKDKALSVENQQTLGSYGLFNSFTGIGGTHKKLSYYAYFHHRSADGWRLNSRYVINTGYASINYAVSSKLSLGLQYTRMDYQSQQPGGLTDEQFKTDARQSSRTRNWFSAPWNVTTATADYTINSAAKLSLKVFSTIAERNSVGFTKAINISDTFNTKIKAYNPRQVDKDAYNNLGAELRYLQSYTLLNQKSSFAAGVRAYKGETIRRQLGTGTSGSDADYSLRGAFGREMTFGTTNFAVFIENLFKFGSRFSVTPGLRYEILNSTAKGFINTSATGTLPDRQQDRAVVLAGIGMEFKTTATTNFYANVSQSYRPVTYSELTPAATTDVIDPNLKDAKGYNADFGYRGNFKNYLNFDVGAFYLNYDNRIGTVLQNNVVYRTNIGTSVSKGIESYVEVAPIQFFTTTSKVGDLRLFVSYAFVDAKYTRWNNPDITNDPAKSIEGKRVENAPQTIARYGLTYVLKGFSATFQLNQVGDSYTDAVNTEKANSTATVGKLAGYTVMDLSLSYLFNERFKLKAGVNNLSNEVYATRRAGGYPGPGLLPSNGRTYYFGLGFNF